MSSIQTAFVKLVTLCGVIAAGCFVVLQVQAGLDNQPSVAPNPAALTLASFRETSTKSGRAETIDTSVADAEATDGSMLLAQATPEANPFDFPAAGSAPIKQTPTLAPKLKGTPTLAPPRNFNAASDPNIKPIADASPTTSQPMPAVVPRGGVQPIPTNSNPGNGLPEIRPAAGKDSDLNLAPIPDPFELNLEPLTESATPTTKPMSPTLEPQPAITPVQPANDPFSLDLQPLPSNPEPLRSASTTAEPKPAANSPFDLEPLPEMTPQPTPEQTPQPIEPLPERSVPAIEPLPEASPFDVNPTPTLNPTPTSVPAERPAALGNTLNVGEAATPSALDFIGDATIDRDVPRGAVQPHLQLTKLAPPRAMLGEPLVYELKVENVGDAVASHVIVEDRIPKGTRLEGTNPQAEMPEGSKRLVWRFDALQPGESKLLRVRITPTEPGNIGSIASVKFAAETAAETRITAPELNFRLSGEPEAALREKVNYLFEISNTGDEDARDVVIRCLVPEGLQSPNNQPDLEYPVGLLAAGESKKVELPLTAIAAGDFTTEAMLEAKGVSPIPSTSKIHIIKNRLGLGRTGPGKRYVGSKVQFTNRVTNNSSKPLANVSITEKLPPNVKFVSASDGGRQVDAETVSWTVGSLPPGSTEELTITYVPNDAGEKVSMVNAIAANGSQTAIKAKMTVIGYAAMDFETNYDNRPYDVGEQISMAMSIHNGGTASAKSVATTIKVPSELRFVSANGPVNFTKAGDSIIFTPIPEIADGSDAKFDLVFETVQPGNDVRLTLQLQSDDLSKPLLDQVSLRVVDLQ